MGEGNIKDVMNFFGMTRTEFTAEWKRLSDEEKDFFKREVAALS